MAMLWFFGSLMLVLGLLLWLPWQVEIDTETGLYRAAWQGIFGIRVEPGAERWRWIYRIFFWENEWRPGRKKPKPQQPQKPVVRKSKRRFSFRQRRALMKNLWRSVELKRLRVNWDSGDFPLNAYLYPAFHFLSRKNRQLHINFYGRQELSILLQVRPYRVVRAFLQAFFHSK